ncbi:MAG: ERF family protein [Paludibacteraceae bacterium]|nr:ERF family protein [Paludibacteraceae bacterium]
MNIFETISAVMADVGAVGKTSKNAQQGFMFRGIDAVMNAINPALVKNKCFVVPEILEQTREERQSARGGTLIYSICRIKYTFYAEDGSNVSAVVIGEGMDSGDKATNKAMSIAFKYACFQVFCIPTEEMVDPDAECHEVTGKRSEPKKTEQKKAEPPKTPDQELIGEKEINALIERCKNSGVQTSVVCELYKVSSFRELTKVKYQNINAFWEKIVEKAKIGV